MCKHTPQADQTGADHIIRLTETVTTLQFGPGCRVPVAGTSLRGPGRPSMGGRERQACWDLTGALSSRGASSSLFISPIILHIWERWPWVGHGAVPRTVWNLGRAGWWPEAPWAWGVAGEQACGRKSCRSLGALGGERTGILRRFSLFCEHNKLRKDLQYFSRLLLEANSDLALVLSSQDRAEMHREATVFSQIM